MKRYQVDMMFCLLCVICSKVTDNSVVSVIMQIFSAVFALLGMFELYVDYIVAKGFKKDCQEGEK